MPAPNPDDPSRPRKSGAGRATSKAKSSSTYGRGAVGRQGTSPARKSGVGRSSGSSRTTSSGSSSQRARPSSSGSRTSSGGGYRKYDDRPGRSQDDRRRSASSATARPRVDRGDRSSRSASSDKTERERSNRTERPAPRTSRTPTRSSSIKNPRESRSFGSGDTDRPRTSSSRRPDQSSNRGSDKRTGAYRSGGNRRTDASERRSTGASDRRSTGGPNRSSSSGPRRSPVSSAGSANPRSSNPRSSNPRSSNSRSSGARDGGVRGNDFRRPNSRTVSNEVGAETTRQGPRSRRNEALDQRAESARSGRNWGSVARRGLRVLGEDGPENDGGDEASGRDARRASSTSNYSGPGRTYDRPRPSTRAEGAGAPTRRSTATSNKRGSDRPQRQRQQPAPVSRKPFSERVFSSEVVRSDQGPSSRSTAPRTGRSQGPDKGVSPPFVSGAVGPKQARSLTRQDPTSGHTRRLIANWDVDLVDLPGDVKEELARLTPKGPKQKGKSTSSRTLAERLAGAAAAYDRDRYGDALRMTRAVLAMAPGSLAARELFALCNYRLGKWEEAIRHLEIVIASSEDETQIPVLMDCYRALGRERKVEELWTELKAASPDADVLVEGRLVLAATYAQSGDLKGAVDLLVKAGAARALRHPAERHVRQWYLLGDLLEQSGDIPRAREMFERVAHADPDLADAADRLAALGRPRRRPARRSSQKSASTGT